VYHYHGALFGKEDNGLNCGWGDVIPVEWAPQEVRLLCVAMEEEEGALRALQANPADYSAAKGYIENAQTALAIGFDFLFSDTNLPRPLRVKLNDTLDAIIKKDQLAQKLVQRQLDSEGQPKDQAHAIKALKAALELKRGAFRKVAKALDLLQDSE
jgi:hypothetical protein